MKNIKKLTKAVAGSALLVGATLAGAASMGAAQSSGSSGMTLGDYPMPFVDEDGNVDSTVVVGESAATVDVVGGINIAGSLGNAAFEENEVSASGSSFGWSATDGVSLDTTNDQVYFGQNLDEVRETLTQDDLPFLEETTFTDDNNEDTDITNFLNVGSQQVTFGNSRDGLDNEDPVLHVPVPAENTVDSNDYLFNLQANMEDGIDFTDADVAGEEITLFGTDFTVAEDMDGGNSGELLLYGSQQSVDVESGQSTTITVNGEEHTLEVVSVNDGSTDNDDGNAAVRVDGELESVESGDTINLGDANEEVRIDEIIKTGGSDSSEGVVNFEIGSQELTLVDGEPIEDEDGDDVEGSRVYFNGNDASTNNNNLVDDFTTTEISSIDLYVGAEDDDEDFLASGDTFSHSLLPAVQVHFGGLNPDAMETGDNVEEFEVSTSGDDDAQISFMADSGDSATLNFAHVEGSYTAGNTNDAVLADEDDDSYSVYEGEAVEEDEYFTADAGDFAHMWEVTALDWDATSTNSGDEATVDLRDAVTGDTVEVELDADDDVSALGSGTDTYGDRKIMDGQAYYFHLDPNAEELYVTYGDSAGYSDAGDVTTVYAPLDTQSGSSVAFTRDADDIVEYTSSNTADTSVSGGVTDTIEVPSTESTDAKSFDITVEENSANTDVNVTIDGALTPATSSDVTETVTVDQTSYVVTVALDDLSDTSAAEYSVDIGVEDGTGTDTELARPAVHVFQPENDDDNENRYTFLTTEDNGDEELNIEDAVYSSPSDRVDEDMESDNDVTAAYDIYGAYSEYDSDEQGMFTLHQPYGQAVAGAAVTGTDGDLTPGGGSGSVTTMSPTGWDNHAALDSDSNVGSLKNNQNLILVGGPAVNNLVSELASANKTWTGDQYSEGDQLIQLVEDAFTDGNSALVVAGYSGEDTRAAANYVADYANNDMSDEDFDATQVNLATQ